MEFITSTLEEFDEMDPHVLDTIFEYKQEYQ